jgi:hypothetical protein
MNEQPRQVCLAGLWPTVADLATLRRAAIRSIIHELGSAMDTAKKALLEAEVAAAERRLERLKQSWADFHADDPTNKVRLDFLAQAIGEGEDLLRAAERALHVSLTPP